MAILSVISVIPVRELAPAVRWYELVIGRPADRVVAEGGVEWELSPPTTTSAATTRLQVREVGPDGRRTGPVDLVIEVDDLEELVGRLRDRGVEVDEGPPASSLRLATVTDVDDNRITFGQDLAAPGTGPVGDATGW